MTVITATGPALPVSPAHGGIEGAWWAAWNVDPQVLIPAALLAFWYARGLGRMRRREHPWWRSALFYSGLAVILLAIESPVDRLGEHHFSFHMVQHELFLLIGVPLLLLGAPTTPVLLGLPKVMRRGLVQPVARSHWWHTTVRWITWPPLAVGQLSLLLLSWHLIPGWFDAALRNDIIHDVQHVSFLAGGMLFWWNVIDPAPLRSRLSYPLRTLYLAPMMATRILLGALLTFSTEPLYEAYAEVRPIVPLDRLQDQEIAALLMWVGGVMMHLVIIGIIFAVWAQKSEARQREEEETRRIEAESERPIDADNSADERSVPMGAFDLPSTARTTQEGDEV